MSTMITKQMISSHIRDIVLSKTTDHARFGRMIKKNPMGSGVIGLGSLEQRITGIKKLIERLDESHQEYKTSVLEWVNYVESGQPIWSEINSIQFNGGAE